MEEWVRLTPSETAAGRPFTDPARTDGDLVAVRAMTARLRRLLGGSPPPRPRPLVQEAPEPDGRQHRVILCDDRTLRAAVEPSWVGFFAAKRPEVDPAPLTLTDDELIQEFPAHPGILSYSSLELADGNWGNLIVLYPPEAREHWRTSEKHAHAARELAPRHYRVVRLHHGLFPGGLLSGREPVLVRTKYYDYQGREPWRAERELPRP